MRRALLATAPALAQAGFYLAGGTAVALYYGHRRSVDLDWFCAEPFEPLGLQARLRSQGIELQGASVAESTLIGWLGRVKVSLFAYPYPLVAPVRVWSDYGVSVAAPEDLLCMKLVAVQQRGTRRDFVDLYVLLRDIPLERAVELYRQKYGFSPGASLVYALTYFADADSEPPVRLRSALSWRQVKRFLQREAAKLVGAD
ncbi:MAG: nucleotidyl transferase AbiEii/AbiGii toxin family protein [Fimbriimonadales bacterium]|nr:nucleotidyl transferase AbiEii/AbiGii toxin family protein [Fimbriimonadales bacterium]